MWHSWSATWYSSVLHDHSARQRSWFLLSHWKTIQQPKECSWVQKACVYALTHTFKTQNPSNPVGKVSEQLGRTASDVQPCIRMFQFWRWAIVPNSIWIQRLNVSISISSELAEHGVLGACLLKTYQMGSAQNKPELPLPLLSNSSVVRAFPKSEDSRFSTFYAWGDSKSYFLRA